MSSFNLQSVVSSEDCRALNSAIGGRRVLLASNSPRRRAILRSCGIAFDHLDPSIDEPAPPKRNHRSWVRRWALRKALSARSLARGKTNLIFAADTIVVHRGEGLGKPKDADEATAMLQMLSGDTHEVITGIAVSAPRHGHSAGSAASRVRFRKLTRKEISDYVASGEPYDKAGAYAIQGGAGAFVMSVDGPIDNVIGLPVRRLAQVTRRLLS